MQQCDNWGERRAQEECSQRQPRWRLLKGKRQLGTLSKGEASPVSSVSSLATSKGIKQALKQGGAADGLIVRVQSRSGVHCPKEPRLQARDYLQRSECTRPHAAFAIKAGNLQGAGMEPRVLPRRS